MYIPVAHSSSLVAFVCLKESMFGVKLFNQQTKNTNTDKNIALKMVTYEDWTENK